MDTILAGIIRRDDDGSDGPGYCLACGEETAVCECDNDDDNEFDDEYWDAKFDDYSDADPGL